MILGPECRRRRLAIGWTREALAAVARVACNTICKLENERGQPRLEYRERIEHALDLIERGEVSPPVFMKFRGQ